MDALRSAAALVLGSPVASLGVAAAGIAGAMYLDAKHYLSRDLWLKAGVNKTLAEIKQREASGTLSMGHLFEEAAARAPRRAALIFEGKEYSYAEMDAASNQLAHWLYSLGVRSGDVVAIILENRPEFLFAYLAISKLSATASFINYNQMDRALIHSLKVSKPKVVIFGVEVAENVRDVAENPDLASFLFYEYRGGATAKGVAFKKLSGSVDAEIPKFPTAPLSKNQRSPALPRTIGILIFTSGTTGLPKAAIIQNLRAYSGASIYSHFVTAVPEDRLYVTLPLYHSAGGIIGIGVAFVTGCTMVLARKFSASRFFQEAYETKAIIFQYIGELCRYLLATKPGPYDNKHSLRIGVGNGMRPDVWDSFQKRFNVPELVEFYNASEGNGGLIVRAKAGSEAVGSIGHFGTLARLMGLVKLVKFDVEKEELIRDKNGLCIEADINEPGELVGRIVQGDATREFAGYYGNKEATEKKITRDVFQKGDTWFRSGDLLRMDERGYFYWVDRIGDTFRWKGENVSTNEVGETVSGYPGILEANVYGVEIAGRDGRAGMAAITLKEGEEFKIEGLGPFLVKRLPSYAIPLFVRMLPAMNITGTFKHQKVDLRKDGIDISKYKDTVYFFDAASSKYVLLTPELRQSIISGKCKL